MSRIPVTCQLEKAVSKDPTRLMLNAPICQDGHVYASNGRILIKIPDVGLPDGVLPVVVVEESRNGVQRGVIEWDEDGYYSVDHRDHGVIKYTRPDLYEHIRLEPSIPKPNKDHLQIWFSPHLLMTLIEAMGCERLNFQIHHSTAPVVVFGYNDDEKEPSVIGVIMPMRV